MLWLGPTLRNLLLGQPLCTGQPCLDLGRHRFGNSIQRPKIDAKFERLYFFTRTIGLLYGESDFSMTPSFSILSISSSITFSIPKGIEYPRRGQSFQWVQLDYVCNILMPHRGQDLAGSPYMSWCDQLINQSSVLSPWRRLVVKTLHAPRS